MSKSIQVAIKVRPLLHREKGMQPSWRVVDNSIQLVDSQAEPFYFDHIFDQTASNELVFDKMAKHIVHSSIQGFNGTIFAYGQTSSGKTYTMMGDAVNPGVMVLAAKELFKEIENANDRQFVLRVGYIEIYNEKIFDLLNKKNQDLKIHETPTGIVNVNSEESIITCEDDLLHYLCMGNKERTTGETLMNERSSRSHAIFRIIIESRKMDRSDDDAITQSILNLVDLAGSERADQTGARGTRLKEGGHINKSLLFLSNVIKRLSESEPDDKYISYRDSKLTRILQASLGGNALTSIICTIKPTAVEETQSTLSFATRAKSIKNKPQVNEIVSDATMMKRLEREIHELKTCLAEERRKNESQIKVGQLEARIKTEVHKIINCNSLIGIRARQQELRRRTWCPATTEHPIAPLFPSRIPEKTTSAPKKALPLLDRHPFLTVRSHDIADISPPDLGFTSQSSIKSDDEHFTPGEEWALSPTRNTGLPRTASITPKGDLNGKLRSIECAFTELQAFTNLEKNLDVRHEAFEALEQKCNVLESRNAALELERIQSLLVKDENGALQLELKATEDRCSALQLQIQQLTALNQAASEQTAKYEQEIAVLKESVKKLEAENRESVSLEFAYKSSKNKAKRRETELLELLADKDREISKLERSLKSMSEERARHCREELLDISRHSNTDEVGNVCVKCEDLETMLAENEKIRIEFEQLTLAYKELQLNYQIVQNEALSTQNNLDELRRTQQQHDGADCDQLRTEISSLREKLEAVQLEFTSQACDRDDKTEECEELKAITERAQQELAVLQQKYMNLEQTSLSQQHALSSIQADYDAIQQKYTTLQLQYAQLEESSAQSVADCVRLQSANEALQLEITGLKQRLEELQQQLQQPNETENTEQAQELSVLRTQFSELQAEHDDLSSQLMDSLQENDTLREQLSKLEQQIREENKRSQLKAPQLEAAESLQSSGIGGMDEECKSKAKADLLKRFSYLVASLKEVELEDLWGKRHLFKAISTNCGVAPACKLYLRNIQEVVATSRDAECNDLSDYAGQVYMQGCLKRHTFSIVAYEEQSNGANEDVCPPANNEAEELKVQLRAMHEEKKALISTTEATVNELREQINRLSAELFEKSLSVEKCTCSEYQKQIESLVKERAEMSLACQDLQERVLSSTCVDDTVNKTLCEEDMIGKEEQESDYLHGLVGQLRATNAGLIAKLQLQERANVELKQLQDRASELEKERDEFRAKNNSLQLELCQKLDMFENESRENFRKFKLELESKEQALSALEVQLAAIQNELSTNSQELQQTREKLMAQTAIVGHLENQVRELERLNAACKCLALQTELDARTAELKSLTVQLESLQNESLAKSEHNTSQKTTEPKPQVFEMEKTITGLRCLQQVVINEKSALESELSTVNAAKSALESELSTVNAAKSALESELSIANAAKSALESELSTANAAKSALESELSTANAAKSALESELSTVNAAKSALESELSTANAAKSALESELSTVNAAKSALESELSTLHADLLKSREQIAELSSANSAYADLENQLNAELSRVNATNSQNLQEFTAAKERINKILQAIKTECVQLALKLQKAENSAENSAVTIQTENSDSLTWEEVCRDLAVAKEIHTARLEEILVAFEGLKREKTALETKYATVNGELLCLRTEKDEVVTKFKAERTELETKLKTELEELRVEKKELETKLEAQKTAWETKLKGELETKLKVEQIEAESKLTAEKTDLETKLLAEKTELETKLKAERLKLDAQKTELATQLKAKEEEMQAKLLTKKTELETQLVVEKTKLETKLKAERTAFATKLEAQKTELETKLKSEFETQLKAKEDEMEAKRLAKKTELETRLLVEKTELETRLKAQRMEFETALETQLKIELDKLKAETIESESKLKAQQTALETRLKAQRTEFETQLETQKTALESQLKSKLETKLKAEKIELESKLNAKRTELETKLLAEKIELETKLQAERTEFETKLEAQRSELESKLKAEKIECSKGKIDLETALATMSHAMQQLKSAKSEAEIKHANVRAELELVLNRLTVEKTHAEAQLTILRPQLENMKSEKMDLEARLAAATSTVKSLDSAKSECERLRVEKSSLEAKLDATTEKLKRLQVENIQLESKLTTALSQLQSHSNELQAQLEHWKVQKNDLEAQVEKERAVYETKLEQQEMVLANLRTENAILQSKIPRNPDIIAECAPLRAELEALKAENDDLKCRLERTIDEAGKCSKMLQKEVQQHKKLLEEQTAAYTLVRKSLHQKEVKYKEDKEKLEGTIACLVSEKSALEEKLYATEMSVKRFESELSALHRIADSSGNSLDLNSSNSPRKGRAKERLSGECLPLKSMNFAEEKSMERLSQKNKKQMEQKNRRLSIHDERRQSFWGATRDVQIMTDPVDKNCNCLELDQKLQECADNLFIREGQVTALTMELKNHPLKTENVVLLKRLQDEQNKHRLEVKKYKQLIEDQNTKVAAAAQAYASANSVHVETQTESDFEKSLHLLQGKYNDLKIICRNRYNLISRLEEQLAQKENAAIDANFSAYEAGQLKALKSECETLKKQLHVVQKKYEEAKAILQMRKKELDRLTEELAALRRA